MPRTYSAPFSVSVSVSVPTWLQGKALNTWFQISGTAPDAIMGTYPAPTIDGVSHAGILAYSSGVLRNSDSKYFLMGGGHNGNWGGNEVLQISLSANAPAWSCPRPPTVPTRVDPPDRQADGRPVTRHTANNIQFDQNRNRMFLFGAFALLGSAGQSTTVEAFNPTTNDWDHIAGTDYPSMPSAATSSNVPMCNAWDANGNHWVVTNSFPSIFRFDTATAAWSTLGNASPVGPPAYGNCGAYDPIRNRIVCFSPAYASGAGGWFTPTTGATNPTWNSVAFSGLPGSPAVIWCPDIGAFLCMGTGGGTVYRIDPVSYAVTTYSVATGTGAPGAVGQAEGSWRGGRFFYIPALKVCCCVHSVTANIYCFRTG